MKRRSNALEVEPTPTPIPASEQRVVAKAGGTGADPIERFAACRSLDELPPELRDNPFVRYAVGRTPEAEAREADALRAHSAAEAMYGDDPERILAAIAAGSHPLQQRPPAPR